MLIRVYTFESAKAMALQFISCCFVMTGKRISGDSCLLHVH